MADIFISYSNSDRSRAMALAQALAQHGWSVWWDREIPIGRSWDEVIEEEIAKARSILVLWSPRAVASDWVKNEARDAIKRRLLVPALIEPTRLPIEFSHIQTADLIAWKPGEPSAEFEKLLAGLRRLLQQSGASSLPQTAASTVTPIGGEARPDEAMAGSPPVRDQKQPARKRSDKPATTRPRTALPAGLPEPPEQRAENIKVRDYSDRIGVFSGLAHNKTYDIKGKAFLEISDISNSGRSVAARFGFSEGLLAKGSLVGTIDEKYRLELIGIISSLRTGSFDCKLSCHFVDRDQIEGEYTLDPRGWNFLSAKQTGRLALTRN
jgi:TIR domain-containing protein